MARSRKQNRETRAHTLGFGYCNITIRVAALPTMLISVMKKALLFCNQIQYTRAFVLPFHANTFLSSIMTPRSMSISSDDKAESIEGSRSTEEQSNWVSIDAKTCKGLYGLGISAVAPRPVAVITSKSKAGVLNCAPFS